MTLNFGLRLLALRTEQQMSTVILNALSADLVSFGILGMITEFCPRHSSSNCRWHLQTKPMEARSLLNILIVPRRTVRTFRAARSIYVLHRLDLLSNPNLVG